MKRDMDLIREILLELEAFPSIKGHGTLEIEGYTAEEIAYNTLLLAEADLIDATDVGSKGGPQVIPNRLTWEGHEFLEASKNDELWNQAKSTLLEKGGGLVFELLKGLLLELTKEALRGTLT